MCGILGEFGASRNSVASFRHALDLLAHRGPDATGVSELPEGYLGHRRLSIIDLTDSANQPLVLNNQFNIQIVFNGEIYNYRELGQPWHDELFTNSDTEIVLKGYAEKGVEFFKRLRGMYAFSIYDARLTPKVILYRDPAGIKPLYYYHQHGQFIFGSEIKALLPLIKHGLNIEEDLIKVYLSLGYCPEPRTAFREIRALEPGHVLEYDIAEGRIRTFDLNSYRFHISRDMVNNRMAGDVTNLLVQSVQRNAVSDVPVKYALSGGIDSSVLVAFANAQGLDPETITVAFDDREFNEIQTVKQYQRSLGIQASVITCSVDDSLPLLKKLLIHFDQPFADSSFVPFYFLAREASKTCKVLIGGDGGDEVQAGYPNFLRAPMIYRWRRQRWFVHLLSQLTPGGFSRKLNKLDRLMQVRTETELLFLMESWIYPHLSLGGSNPFRFDIRDAIEFYDNLQPPPKGASFNEVFQFDVFTKRLLGDYLRKTDMMSMINSLEYRVPLLDEDFVAYSLQIPLSSKTRKGKGKSILRTIHSSFYPPQTSNLPKQGFSIPLDTWLSVREFKEIEEYVLDSRFVSEFVNPKYIHGLFAALRTGRYSRAISRAGQYQQILTFYSLQLWYNEVYSRWQSR